MKRASDIRLDHRVDGLSREVTLRNGDPDGPVRKYWEARMVLQVAGLVLVVFGGVVSSVVAYNAGRNQTAADIAALRSDVRAIVDRLETHLTANPEIHQTKRQKDQDREAANAPMVRILEDHERRLDAIERNR